jgi:hypothetical protein
MGAAKVPAKSPAYDRRQANRISLRIVLAVAIALAAYMAVELSTDPVRADDSSIRVSAIFGFRLLFSDIRGLELVKSPVIVGKRVFGNDAFGLFREGDFEVEGIGRARVFLKKPNVSYLSIRTDDKDYALSLGSLEKDQLLYDRIKLGMR